MPETLPRSDSFTRVLLVLLLSLCLTSCGYRLAGTAELPSQLATIQLETTNFREIQRKALERSLESAGATLVEQASADAVRLTVTLLSEPDRRLANSASSGTVVKRLSRGLTYVLHSADDEIISPAQTLKRQVDVTLSDDSLLASNQEKDRAIQELEQSLYERLVIQLTRILVGS